MRTLTVPFALSLLVLPLSGQEFIEPMPEEREGGLYGTIASPITFPDGDDWEYSGGIEGRLGLSTPGGLRIYGLVGYSYWYPESDLWIVGFDNGGISGDANIFSVGGGVEFFHQINFRHTVSIGANYQYQYVDSDVRYEVSSPFLIERQNIDIGDASALYAGVDYYFTVNERLSLSFGLGYLTNLTTADVTFEGERLDDTKFEGFTIRIGAGF